MAIPDYTETIAINVPPKDVWQAIIDPDLVAQYHLAPLREIQLTRDGVIVYGTDSEPMIVGKITEIEEGARLSHTFRFQPNQEGTKDDPETTVSYFITQTEGGSSLKMIHSGFTQENQTYANISGGWPYILNGLKAFLERK